jgi:hypothetical protein
MSFTYCKGPGEFGNGCDTALWVPPGAEPYCPRCQATQADPAPRADNDSGHQKEDRHA